MFEICIHLYELGSLEFRVFGINTRNKGPILYLVFCHCHSHSHNDISNVYLLVLSKATG